MSVLQESKKKTGKTGDLESEYHNYACRMYRRDCDRLLKLADHLEIVGDGSPVSFADCVRWMLQLPAVEKIVDNMTREYARGE